MVAPSAAGMGRLHRWREVVREAALGPYGEGRKQARRGAFKSDSGAVQDLLRDASRESALEVGRGTVRNSPVQIGGSRSLTRSAGSSSPSRTTARNRPP